jgi:hypothetical protein
MFGRGGEDAKAGVVEHPGGRRVPVRCDIGTGLLVQPPAGQAELGCYGQCFLKDDAMRLEEGIDVPGSPARVVRKGHRGATEHIEVCHHATPGQPVAKTAEGLLDARAVEQRRGIAHAASIS